MIRNQYRSDMSVLTEYRHLIRDMEDAGVDLELINRTQEIVKDLCLRCQRSTPNDKPNLMYEMLQI